MATIQVRVDDSTKAAADSLFSSLGLDTSTAVRMFIAAAIAARGIPFTVKQNDVDRDLEILKAVEYRKAGGHFYSKDEFLSHMLEAIAEGAKHD